MGINEWWTNDGTFLDGNHQQGKYRAQPHRAPALRRRNVGWSYETVRHVRPGDIVLHWHEENGPALTGNSHCSMPAVASSLEWQSRGTCGRTHDFAGEEDAREALLQGYRELPRPITLERIRALEP